MPAPFHRLTITQFQLLMDRTLLRRAIDAVHVHHTWKPARADWRGEATIVAMQRYHQSLEGRRRRRCGSRPTPCPAAARPTAPGRRRAAPARG